MARIEIDTARGKERVPPGQCLLSYTSANSTSGISSGYGITERASPRIRSRGSRYQPKRRIGMSQLPAGAFRRYDETPDEEFYNVPRLVTHLNVPNYKTSQAEISRPADQ